MTRHEESLSHALRVLGQVEYRQYIDAIYLYGSCARGTQKFHSDVDLLIKLKEDTPKKIIRRMRIDVIPDEELPEVELKFYINPPFSSSPQFNANIEREGVLLWQRE